MIFADSIDLAHVDRVVFLVAVSSRKASDRDKSSGPTTLLIQRRAFKSTSSSTARQHSRWTRTPRTRAFERASERANERVSFAYCRTRRFLCTIGPLAPGSHRHGDTESHPPLVDLGGDGVGIVLSFSLFLGSFVSSFSLWYLLLLLLLLLLRLRFALSLFLFILGTDC